MKRYSNNTITVEIMWRLFITNNNVDTIINKFSLKHPFIRQCIDVFIKSELKFIRNRHRIVIEDCASLLGVMDEYGVLKENEVFVQIERAANTNDHNQIRSRCKLISGDVIITKCPALAPGDLRKFTANGTDEVYQKLKHLKNVVVFSQMGMVSPTMQMAGSDLDGDVYWITWDKRLLSCFDYHGIK